MIDKRVLEKRLRRQKETIESMLTAEVKPRFAARHLSLDRGLLILTGARGVGKTTTALDLLRKSGAAFAYTDLSDLPPFKAAETEMAPLLEVLCMVYGEFEWLLLDEFLCRKEWESLVKYFRMIGIKVFAVSSGVLPNKDVSHPGCASVLYPLSFSEYCLWHDVNSEPKNPVELASLRMAFDDFSMRGGFPANQDKTRIKSTIAKIENAILDNDLRGDFRKGSLPAIREIGASLIGETPCPVFYNEIAERFSLRSEITAKKYLEAIKGSAAVYPLERFAFQERVRNYGEQLYAVDPCFSPTDRHEARLKIILYMQLRRFCERHGYQMHYYGNRDMECDFVLCHEMKMRTIIQVIYDYSDSQAIKDKVASLISLSSSSGCGKLFILTDNCHDTIETRGLSIYVKPAYEFLLDRSHMII